MSAPSAPDQIGSVIAEQHRIERLVSGLRNGESMVINGTPVTAISLEVADLLTRHWWASARCSRLSAAADYDGCLRLQDEMAMCRCQLAAVGLLHLVESDDHGKVKDPQLPQRPRGPHPVGTVA